jgi:hypothetical protein
MVTDRMLEMFKKKKVSAEKDRKQEEK